MKMNPEIKTQWLHALRSGEYTQGKRVLHHHEINSYGETISEYCCLGVLCDLAVKAGVLTVQDQRANGAVIYGKDEYTILPSEVMEWAGLDVQVPLVPAQVLPEKRWMMDVGGVKLSHLNDTENWNFHQIADAIEKYL